MTRHAPDWLASRVLYCTRCLHLRLSVQHVACVIAKVSKKGMRL